MAKRPQQPVDETWLQEVAKDLREAGYDDEFVEACLEDIRDGAEVTIVIGNEDC